MPSNYRFSGSLTADPEQQIEALLHFFEQKNANCFENLTTLSIMCATADTVLLTALVELAPRLEELSLDGLECSWHDTVLAPLVFKVASKGWKTLGFKCFGDTIGPLTVVAILKNSATLENLRLPNCKAFGSKSIQQLLCSAPNLKRFDTVGFYYHTKMDPYSLMAMDIVESSKDWVCLGLESFKCYIGGVPRPDVTLMKCSRPLTGIYNGGSQYSMAESRVIQRKVLAQLGRLTKLREITLGKDVVDCRHQELNDWEMLETEMEDEYIYAFGIGNSAELELKEGIQYQCLTMSLQDGLDELKNLKCLRRLNLERMSLNMGQAEQTWMEDHWPEYKDDSKYDREYEKDSRDHFWTSRGHRVGTDKAASYTLSQSNFRFSQSNFRLRGDPDDPKSYDWW